MEIDVPKEISGTAGDQLLAQIENLDGLPIFPAMATQILDETKKEDVDVSRVIQLVECEPTISAKVLQMANSPLYGVPRPISTIGHAVVILGYRAVAQLAVSIAMKEIFQLGDAKVSSLREQIFLQSLASATTARVLAKELGTADADEAFLCGVMHDIGKLVLLASAPSEYSNILIAHPNDSTVNIEENWVGTNHALIGKRCGIKWGLPGQLNKAIENHHQPFSESLPGLTNSIIAANYASQRWQIGITDCEMPKTDDGLDQLITSSISDDLRLICEEQFMAAKDICST